MYTWGRDGNGTQPELYTVFKERVQHRIYKTCQNEVLFCSQMLSQQLLTIHLPFHYYHWADEKKHCLPRSLSGKVIADLKTTAVQTVKGSLETTTVHIQLGAVPPCPPPLNISTYQVPPVPRLSTLPIPSIQGMPTLPPPLLPPPPVHTLFSDRRAIQLLAVKIRWETEITRYIIWNGEYTSVALFGEWQVQSDSSPTLRCRTPLASQGFLPQEKWHKEQEANRKVSQTLHLPLFPFLLNSNAA